MFSSRLISNSLVYHIHPKLFWIKKAIRTDILSVATFQPVCCPHQKRMLSSRPQSLEGSLVQRSFNTNLDITVKPGLFESVFSPQYHQHRGKKDKAKKEKGGKAKPKIVLRPDELNQVLNFNQYEEDLKGLLDRMKQEYVEKLTIRKSAAKLDNLLIDTPDGKFLLIHLAQISQKTPELYVIDMTTSPQYIGNVKTVIEESGMNINIQQEKTTLFASLPKFTFEHRTSLANAAKTLWQNTKEKQRNCCNQNLKKLEKEKKASNLSLDYVHSIKEIIEFTMRKYQEEADKIMQAKQADLLGESDSVKKATKKAKS